MPSVRTPKSVQRRDPAIYQDTAQHGDGHSLEFAGVGIVNYVFQQGYAQHLGVDPDGCEQRYHEGYEDVKNNGHDLFMV